MVLLELLIEDKEKMSKWDWKRNSGEKVDRLSNKSGKNVWWICEKGHSFKACISSKVTCKMCNSFGYNYPEIAKMWSDRNEKTPFEYSRTSGVKVWWVCNAHGEYKQEIRGSIKGSGCRKCFSENSSDRQSRPERIEDSLGFLHPEILEEWSDKNDRTAYEYYPQSSKKAWFTCPKGHGDFYKTISDRTNSGNACTVCRYEKVSATNSTPKEGESLGEKAPHLIDEWSENNETTPFDHNVGSKTKVLWVCPEHGEYLQAINLKSIRGYGCVKCGAINSSLAQSTPQEGNSLADKYPWVKDIWSELNDVTPYDRTPYSGLEAWFKCESGIHEDYRKRIVSITQRNQLCPSCARGANITIPNRIIMERYRELNLVPELRIDIQGNSYYADISSLDGKLVIEFDSCHWHKDILDSDTIKTHDLVNNGHKVIRVRENGLTPIDVSSPNYHEIEIDLSPGYNYRNPDIKNAFIKVFNEMDEILGIDSEFDIDEIIESILMKKLEFIK